MAGFKIVVTPALRAISNPRWTASIGNSSCVRNTFAERMVLDAASTSAGVSVKQAPAQR